MDCKACHKPLRKLNWNKDVSILVCDDTACLMYRTSQGTTDNIVEEIVETKQKDILDAIKRYRKTEENDGRKTKELRGAKVESARRKSKAKRRVGKARKDGSQLSKVGRRHGKVVPGKRKAISFV